MITYLFNSNHSFDDYCVLRSLCVLHNLLWVIFGGACDLLSSPGGSVDEHLSGQALQPPVDERPLGQTLDLLLMSSEHPSGLAVQQPAVDERPSGQTLQPRPSRLGL